MEIEDNQVICIRSTIERGTLRQLQCLLLHLDLKLK